MKEEETNIEKTVSVCSAKSEEEVLREITFFISRFFIVELENPTEEDARQATRLAKLVILLMAQMLERGMRQKREPVFNAMFYVEDLGGGVGKLNYAFESLGGQMFEDLNLGVMGKELEDAIGEWCKKTWGGKLTTRAADAIQAWSGVTDGE